VVRHAVALREERTVAVVTVDELEDARGLPERPHMGVDFGPVHGVDEPHAPARAQGVRGALEQRRLLGDPAESERGLVANPGLHLRHPGC
jgi:hypothetical protein